MKAPDIISQANVSARVRKRLFKGYLVALALLALGIFLATVGQQSSVFGARKIMEGLVSARRVLPLHEWSLSLHVCEAALQTCSTVGAKKSIRIPGVEGIKSALQSAQSPPQLALLSYDLSEEQWRWVQEKKRVSLVLPRSVQTLVKLKIGDRVELSGGMGTQSEFMLEASELAGRKISLEYNVSRLPWFGPSELPIALVELNTTGTYQSLTTLQSVASGMTKQLQTGLPALVALMALLLDYNRIFALFAGVSVVRSLRSFVPYWVENFGSFTAHTQAVLMALNGLSLGLLVSFALVLSGLRVSKRLHVAVCLVPMLAGVTLGFGWPSLWVQGDLWADLISSTLSVAVLLWGLFRVLRHKNSRKGLGEKTPLDRLEFGWVVARKIIIASAFLAYGVGNGLELFGSDNAGLKAIIDWKFALFYPALTLAVFLEVGSAAQKISVVAREMTEKEIQDREMEMGRLYQAQLLPPKRRQTRFHEWRSVYIPASKLAGDWFDIRELKFLDDRHLLVAVITDVTGHGVRAALTTTVLSAYWGQWCEESRLEMSPTGAEAKERFLESAAYRLNHGLRGSRHNGGCTAVFLLMDPDNREVTVCQAGHPAPMQSNNREIKTLPGPGGGLLGERDDGQWHAATHALLPGGTVYAFSDGLFESQEPAGSYFQRMRRELKSTGGEIPVASRLLRKVRKMRTLYRADREGEDDITLVMLRLVEKSPQPESAPQDEKAS